MSTPLSFPAVSQGSVDKWDVPLKSDLIAIRDRADQATPSLFWDPTTHSWPAIPAAIPSARVVVWDSMSDATATAPPAARVGDRWIKKDT